MGEFFRKIERAFLGSDEERRKKRESKRKAEEDVRFGREHHGMTRLEWESKERAEGRGSGAAPPPPVEVTPELARKLREKSGPSSPDDDWTNRGGRQ